MVDEVLEALAPTPGDVAVDATLGFGGHARTILERIQPGGRLIGLDVDPIELPRTEARLRAAGFGADGSPRAAATSRACRSVLADEGLAGADVILADLGVSSMQLDNPERGFTYKEAGPLDMRMNPARGEPASLLAGASERRQAGAAPRRARRRAGARKIARALKAQPVDTTHALARIVRKAAGAGRRGEGGPAHVPGAAHRRQRRVLRARRAAAPAAGVPGARRPRRDPDVSFRRGPAREEGVRGRRSARAVLGDRGRGGAAIAGRSARESPRGFGQAAMGGQS